MIKKDRYSHAIIIAVVFLAIALYLLRQGKEKYAFTTGMIAAIGLSYFGFLFLKSARLNGSVPKEVKFKDEKRCGFTGDNPKQLDGIAFKEKRYKLVNGTDVSFNKNNQLKPCGFGSAIMQKIGGGGKEPKSIQKDKCWEINASTITNNTSSKT